MGDIMKKWHMEEIVLSTGNFNDKLELPQQSWKIRWAALNSNSAKKTRAGRFFNRFRRKGAVVES